MVIILTLFFFMEERKEEPLPVGERPYSLLIYPYTTFRDPQAKIRQISGLEKKLSDPK